MMPGVTPGSPHCAKFVAGKQSYGTVLNYFQAAQYTSPQSEISLYEGDTCKPACSGKACPGLQIINN